jgi:hypothetical protein
MVDNEGPPTILVPARRILVVEDLGHVSRGDHVLMVANVIVSVDTSRNIESAHLPLSGRLPMQKQKRQRMLSVSEITQDLILKTIQDHNAPVSSMEISDSLNLERKDPARRGKVTRIISSLLETGQIKRAGDGRTKLFRYKVANLDAETLTETEAEA